MLNPGQRLGDFEIIRLLGQGGMGHVYEAKQFHPERRVALKVLAPAIAEKEAFLERFWRETQALAQLDHPGIVRIIATGSEHGVAYYAMQLIQGLSLAGLLRMAKETDRASKSSPPPASTSRDVTPDSLSGSVTPPYLQTPAPLPQTPSLVNAYCTDRYTAMARIGLQAAQALASAHRLGLVHRDVKPSNIMVDQHDQVYIVDFGLTRSLDTGALTQTGILIGTPWYMSPEQASHAKVDCRTDVYSLGVTLYHLATGGEGPYTANRDDTEAVLEQVRSGAILPVDDLAPEIPRPLAAILMRALAVDPARRYPSAAEMARDLEMFLQSGVASKTQVWPGPPTARRSRFAWTALAVTAVALIIWLIPYFSPTRQVDPPADKSKTDSQREENPFAGRVRPLNVRLPLLREDMQPDRYQFLLGQEKGSMQPIGKELILRSMDSEKPFLVALDDPGRDPYEFSIEVKPGEHELAQPNQYGMGLFFGWRSKAPDPRTFPRFFVLTLDRTPIGKDIHGRLKLQTWNFFHPVGGVTPPFESMPVSLGGRWLALPPADDYCEVRVRVDGERLSVSVDQVRSLKCELDELVRENFKLQQAHVEFQGAFGIWVRNGFGFFRNATLKALPREQP